MRLGPVRHAAAGIPTAHAPTLPPSTAVGPDFAPELRLLDFGTAPHVGDALLLGLRGLSQVQALDLSGCNRFGDAALQCLLGVPVLTRLDLSGCNQLTGSGFRFLPGLAATLEVLSCCGCSGATDSSAEHLGASPVGWPPGPAPAPLTMLPSVAGAAGLTSLQSIDLSSTHLTDIGLYHLKNLVALTSIELQGVPGMRGRQVHRTHSFESCEMPFAEHGPMRLIGRSRQRV